MLEDVVQAVDDLRHVSVRLRVLQTCDVAWKPQLSWDTLVPADIVGHVSTCRHCGTR